MARSLRTASAPCKPHRAPVRSDRHDAHEGMLAGQRLEVAGVAGEDGRGLLEADGGGRDQRIDGVAAPCAAEEPACLGGEVAVHDIDTGVLGEQVYPGIPAAAADRFGEGDRVNDERQLELAGAGDPRAVAWIARARELQLTLVVNAVTLTESIRGGGRDARVHLLTKNARVDTVDGDFAAEAGRLLGRTGRSDTVDALVATTAIRLKQPTTILTSDPRDL